MPKNQESQRVGKRPIYRTKEAQILHTRIFQYITKGAPKTLNEINALFSSAPPYLTELSSNQMSILFDIIKLTIHQKELTYEQQSERCLNLLQSLFNAPNFQQENVFRLFKLTNKDGNLPILHLFKYPQEIVQLYFETIENFPNAELRKEVGALQFLHLNNKEFNSFSNVYHNGWAPDLKRYFSALNRARELGWLTNNDLNIIFSHYLICKSKNFYSLNLVLDNFVQLKKQFGWDPEPLLVNQHAGLNLLLSLGANLSHEFRDERTPEQRKRVSIATIKSILSQLSSLISNETPFLLYRNEFNQTFLMPPSRPPLFDIFLTHYKKALLDVPRDELESFLLARNSQNGNNILHHLALSAARDSMVLLKNFIEEAFLPEQAFQIWNTLLYQKNDQQQVPCGKAGINVYLDQERAKTFEITAIIPALPLTPEIQEPGPLAEPIHNPPPVNNRFRMFTYLESVVAYTRENCTLV